MNNKFQYSTSTGICKGNFGLYQSKNGAITLLMGNSWTVLTEKQVNELSIDVYSLPDFNYDDYLKYYTKNKGETIQIIMSLENNTWRQ